MESVDQGALALVFPGQGSQYVGMGRDLFANFKVAEETFEEASDALHIDLRRLCLDGPEDDLTRTVNAQPAILTVSIAVLRILRQEAEIPVKVVAGHSLGEYSALVAAGSLSFIDAVKAVWRRGELMQSAVPPEEGGMAALLGLCAAEVERLCLEVVAEFAVKGEKIIVAPANYNSAEQIVISGHTRGVERASELAREFGARHAIRLAVSAPFHSELMKPAAEGLAPFLEGIRWSSLQCPYIANVDAKWHGRREGIAGRLVAQMTASVLWEESVKSMAAGGVTKFYEIGPKRVLSRLIEQIVPGAKTRSVEDRQSLKEVLADVA
ncbi:MAG: ACP S-malonyltransferase [Deltaproteobacteria bacterium]|nr:ACP S-malonyltransferase [Deltaproteobacteria bacterium]